MLIIVIRGYRLTLTANLQFPICGEHLGRFIIQMYMLKKSPHGSKFGTFRGVLGGQIDQALILGLILRELGYNPNSTDETELYEALDMLIGYANNSNLVHISDDPSPLLIGDLDIVLTYSGEAFQRINNCDCDNLKYVVPYEGTVADITAMVLLKDAPNPDLAYLFMDFMQGYLVPL